jgi:hypothetical protein
LRGTLGRQSTTGFIAWTRSSSSTSADQSRIGETLGPAACPGALALRDYRGRIGRSLSNEIWSRFARAVRACLPADVRAANAWSLAGVSGHGCGADGRPVRKCGSALRTA